MNREAFEQQISESARAFEAFKTYRDMGPARSLEAVAKKLSKSATIVKRWSARWRWQERIKAWAKHIEDTEREALDAKMKEKANEWAAREEKCRDANWDLAQEARSRVKGMFAFPLATTKSKDGKTIVSPTAWRLADAARLMEAILKLEAAALGLPTHRAEISGKDGASVAPQAHGQVIVYIPEEEPLPDEE